MKISTQQNYHKLPEHIREMNTLYNALSSIQCSEFMLSQLNLSKCFSRSFSLTFLMFSILLDHFRLFSSIVFNSL